MAPMNSSSGDVFQAHLMGALTTTVPLAPSIYELNGEYIAEGVSSGQRAWSIRGQNFCISIAWMASGEVLHEEAVPDEHAILVFADTCFDIATDGGSGAQVDGPSFVVVPAGTTTLSSRRAGFVMRVFSGRAAAVMKRSNNSDRYATRDPRVVPLPEKDPIGPGTLRVHPLSESAAGPTRFGRIFRTESLMINWFEAEVGPRDIEHLTPHDHADFEQASVTLAGEFVHHLRTPWTARLRDWRPDEHVQCTSPSVTIIPPGILHTTRAVGHQVNQLIDVFAPPRADFLDKGWVLNQSDYE